PGVSVVSGFIKPGRVIVELVTRGGDVSGGLVVWRDFDRIDQALFQTFRRDVLPVCAAITRHVDESIVAAGPDHAFLVRRLHDVSERAVVLCTDGFVRVWPTALALLVLLIACEVRRDLFPSLPPVARLQHILSAVKISIGLIFTPDDRRVPIETILD